MRRKESKPKKPKRPSRRERKIAKLINEGYKVERSEYRPVSLYRSYGKKRIENENVEKANVVLIRALACLILSLLAITFATGAIAVLLYAPLLIRTVIWVAIAYYLARYLTKIPRKRLDMLIKLRAVCQAHGWRLTREKGFFDPLKWCSKGVVLTIETPHTIYYVNTIGVQTYGMTLVLAPDGVVQLKKKPRKNIFTIIFDIKGRKKAGCVDFSGINERFDKRQECILLVNPVCQEIKYRISEHSYSVTGNGGKHFGYTLFTATGFLNYLERNEQEAKRRDPFGL